MIRPWLAIGLAAIALCLAAPTARAQRVTFPTPAPGDIPSPASTYGNAYQPPPSTFDPYALPSTSPQTAGPYLPPADSPYAAPGAYSPYSTAPPPYSGSPSALISDGAPAYTGQGFAPISNTWNTTMRFMQEVHADETWLARGGGSHAMGINTINTWAAFAVPFYWNARPLLVTPGFQLNLWDGPVAFGAEPATLPPQTYGAYLDFAWNPQITNWLGAELEVSPGIYTDFQHTTTQSFRILGRGLGVITLTPTLQAKAGIWYIDRLNIKLLPAGGLFWTPNPDNRFEIFFPAPKLAHRCATVGNHNLWAYLRGEYGGGAWTVRRPAGGVMGELNDEFEYSDLRVALGMDILPETQTGLRGYLEVGYAFERQLLFRSDDPHKFNVSDTVLVGGGFSF